MGHLYRCTLLFFAMLLPCAGSSGRSPGVAVQEPPEENPRPAISKSEHGLLLSMLRSDERAVGGGSRLPSPTAKSRFVDISGVDFYLELRVQRLAALYLSRSMRLRRSLTGCDIIFPFHYFL